MIVCKLSYIHAHVCTCTCTKCASLISFFQHLIEKFGRSSRTSGVMGVVWAVISLSPPTCWLAPLPPARHQIFQAFPNFPVKYCMERPGYISKCTYRLTTCVLFTIGGGICMSCSQTSVHYDPTTDN